MSMSKGILLGGDDAMEVDEDLNQLADGGLFDASSIDDSLPSSILPSPYPQHQQEESRYQNALQRIQAKPTADVEAWEAVLTEVQGCYSRIPNVHAVDAETQAQLDWIESCWGSLLVYFPYAEPYLVQLAEFLMRISARVGEDGGPAVAYGMDVTKRSRKCDLKAERVFKENLLPMDEMSDGEQTGEGKAGGMLSWSVPLWLLYIRKVKRDAHRSASTLPVDERVVAIREPIKKAYELAVKMAGSVYKNHELWKDYLNWIRSSFEQQQQMFELRSVYQKLVTHPMTGLDQLWQEYEIFEKAQNEVLAQALIAEWSPKYSHARSVYLERSRVYQYDSLQLGRLATPPASEKDEDYTTKQKEECDLLKLWKTRCSYERTNPERLSSADLTQRIRQLFQEMVCVLTRHPESWHMWSAWESEFKVARCVLQWGQAQIPDCTLLAHAECLLVEESNGEACLQVMERFVERAPNTLGFILLQQLVRRYKGIQEAREIFARARRALSINAEVGASEIAESGLDADDDDKQNSRWIVTNRLPSTVGQVRTSTKPEEGTSSSANAERPTSSSPGPVTWHLYAAQAMIEHRWNLLPKVAARVYELGLRKHSVFLTKPPYILRYSQLLLELGDTVNLRALLTRAVAACQNDEENKAALIATWDMNLYFESITASGPDRVKRLKTIESQRRAAIMGPDVEDVGTGGFIGRGEAALIGASKSSIADQLIRLEGYDTSSGIVNGLHRSVDVLGVMGFWGNQDVYGRRGLDSATSDLSGGKSDASYYARMVYMNQGSDPTIGIPGLAADASKRDRSAASAAVSAGPASAMMLAIQTSPEWLRSLLLLLPASRLRLPIVAKPPPHLVELALTGLQKNDLPAERPAEASRVNGIKRSANDDSDDENGGTSGGFGSLFRARQRQRQVSGL